MRPQSSISRSRTRLRYDSTALRFRLIGDDDDIELVETASQARRLSLLNIGRQVTRRDEIDARLVLDSRMRIDQLGVRERRHRVTIARANPARCRVIVIARSSSHPKPSSPIAPRMLTFRTPKDTRLFAIVPAAPGVTSVRTTARRGIPVSREGSVRSGS